MRDVAIVGAGTTKFGELWNDSLRDIGIQAGFAAIQDAKIESHDIDALYVGNMAAGRYIAQEHVAALITDYSGLSSRHISATRVEAACASGGVALHNAYLAVASGMYDTVVVGGAEKMTDATDAENTEILAASADAQWETFFGATFPALFAMMARAHMQEHGTTREQMAQVAVKNHAHGALNPNAQFQKEIDLDTVLNAGMVADPLGVFDCSPISDGGSALVLMPLEKALSHTKRPVIIRGSTIATDTLGLHARPKLTSMAATKVAGQRALTQAKKTIADIHLAELHDCFTIAELIALEDLGFVKAGEAGAAVAEGRFHLKGGQMPVNTSGGLKARGHPCGATGIAQVVEAVFQLQGRAGARQVKGATTALTHNVGGSGATVTVHVLEAT